MPKIKIKDLPEDMKISDEELAEVRGGFIANCPNPSGAGSGLPAGRPAGTAMDCLNRGLSNPLGGKMSGPWRCQ